MILYPIHSLDRVGMVPSLPQETLFERLDTSMVGQ